MSSRPLLPQQERFRELALDPEKFPSAHIALAFELKGEVKKELLAEAFRHVWEKADLGQFRTDLKEGTQWKEAKLLPVAIEFTEARDAEVKTYLTKDFERSFDLLREAPLRLRLVQTKPNKAILGLVAHHLAMDGWSLSRILEKVADTYNALVRGEPLPELPWESYWSYLEEHARQLALPSTEASRKFWREREFRASPLLPECGVETRGHRVIYIFNKKYYAKIKELAKANKVTPFLFLLTCFSRSMAKVLKKSDFLLSVPIATRDWDRAEFVIGNCVNLMPLDVHLSEEADLLSDLRRMRALYVDHIGHALVPTQEIERMHPAKDLTQLHFNFEPSVEEPKLEGLEIEFYPFPVTRVEKPLIINVNDTKKTYYVEIDYQFQALDLVKALTLFTETERVINKIAALTTPPETKS